MRRVLLVIAVAIWSAPAAACYSGPVPLDFVRDTAQLSRDGKNALSAYVEMRGINRQNRVLVMFYGGVPTSTNLKLLHQNRRRAVRTYLASKRVPHDAISIVTTKKAPPNILTEFSRRRLRPMASVELTSGCGG